MADEIRQIDVIMGPYRDNRLTVSAADADAAINAHWARDPFAKDDPDHPHPPLTDQQRTDAFVAAHTWAQAQWNTAQGTKDQPHVEHRAMKPAEAESYATRQTAPATEPKKK